MIPQPSVIVVCSARTHACMLVLFEYVRTYVAILQSLYACMHTTYYIYILHTPLEHIMVPKTEN